MDVKPSWETLVADKQRRQQAAIPDAWRIAVPGPEVVDVSDVPRACGLLSTQELEITETTDVDVLLAKLAARQWTSVEVTTAFYKRAIIAQQLTNCLTEIFVERALKRASELDHHLETTGKVFGPLHGLPISIKDQLCMEGLETTMGYVSWIGKYADRNAVLVDILLEAGAVPFVRTNVPQTLMWGEAYNKVFGRTTNPYNRLLTSGGSSGGEGALIALKGSPLGIGSDIGGSIRIPSAYCGLYGLRPSCHRVPYAGAMNSMEGSEGVSSVFGPMANSLTSLITFMKAVIACRPWTKDPYVIRKAWDEDAFRLSEHGGLSAKLCIGIMWHNAHVRPLPPVTRGLEIAKQALLTAGHTVIDFEWHRGNDMSDILHSMWGAGSYEDYTSVTSLSGEPLLAEMLPEKEDEVMAHKPGISAYELWQVHRQKKQLQQEWLDHWNDTVKSTGTGRPIDALICPVGPIPATPHGRDPFLYTAYFNLLDYPAVVLPVTKLDPAVDVTHLRESFFSDDDKAVWEWYTPERTLNSPICIQLAAQTLEDEALLGMAQIVDAVIKEYQNKA